MAALLRPYLSRAYRRGFEWGEHDCILFAAGWVREVCGVDPARAWRSTYTREDQAKAILSRLGGINAVMAEALGANGWRTVSVDELQGGEIVVAAPNDGRGEHAAAIATGKRKVALLTRRGLVVHAVPVLTAWRFDEGMNHG